MSDTALFHAPDGTASAEVFFSTTATTRFFTGEVPAGVVDVEVELTGYPYTTDPSLVLLAGTAFTFPNPAAYPDGFPLVAGDNVFSVRGVLLDGARTPSARMTVRLVAAPSYDDYAPPSPVTLERGDGSVTLTIAVTEVPASLRGFHFYASRDAGGGATGYTRLTPSPVSTYELRTQTTPLFTLTAQSELADSENRYLRAAIYQEDADGNRTATDGDDRVLLPDDAEQLETVVSISQVVTQRLYSFNHQREAGPDSETPTVFVGQFASLPPNDPLFYAATAVYWDAELNTEFESYYSVELVGSPIQVRNALVGLPAVGRSQLVEDAVTAIHRANPAIAIQPGSVTRDTVVDPLAAEAERLRFIADFYYRASSFDLLLAIDDPDGTGTSVDPSQSAYKTALASAFFLANPADIQPVIDAAFEKLALNFGRARLPGRRARGEARFYTTATPTRSLPLPLGTFVSAGAVQFRTLRSAELSVDQLASYYDPSQRTYSITVPVEAVAVGSASNVGPRQINSAAVFGFSVTNDTATFGGTDRESNAKLAAAARGGISAVDTGTRRGLARVAADVAGVASVQVVRAGSPLMHRDYDTSTASHRGGAVDVWFRGRRMATVRDTFHFSYESRYAIQFVVSGDPALGRFTALDPDLTPSNPLAAMLDYADRNLGLFNLTLGERYDLTGVSIVNYNTIEVSSSVAQPATSLGHVIIGDYRYRLGQQYVFSRQPVSAVFGIVGEQTGALDPQTFTLVHPHPALTWGRSVRAADYLQMVESTDASVVSPLGQDVTVSGETHVLTGYYDESVFRLGADPLTVVVRSSDGMTEYRGPDHPSGIADYTVVSGTANRALAIRRTRGSAIPDGGTVAVDYAHSENFTVTYQTNLVVGTLQEELDESSHAGSSVLGKESIEVPVDITSSIFLARGAQRSVVDRAIRARLSYLLATLGPRPLRRSDVIATLDRTPGVSYVAVPLTRLARAVGSLVPYDSIRVTGPSEATLVTAWSSSAVNVWLLEPELSAPTLNGGGAAAGPGQFRGVFQGSDPLVLQEADPATLASSAGRAFIVGADGVVVPGYGSGVTRNRLLVTLPVGESPVGRDYWASYVVGTNEGEYDITPSEVEYLVLGEFTATYAEDPAG